MKTHARGLGNDNSLKGKYVFFGFLNMWFFRRKLDQQLVLKVPLLVLVF